MGIHSLKHFLCICVLKWYTKFLCICQNTYWTLYHVMFLTRLLGAFPDGSHLCVMKCLRHYEDVTAHWAQYRKKDPSIPQPLFLSYIKPHLPVTLQRIANWLKEIPGVDTSSFKAHSVRGASSIAALKKVVSLKTFSTQLTGILISFLGVLLPSYTWEQLWPRPSHKS